MLCVTLYRVGVGDVHQCVGFEVGVSQLTEQSQCGVIVLKRIGLIAGSVGDESQRVEHGGFTISVLVQLKQIESL